MISVKTVFILYLTVQLGYCQLDIFDLIYLAFANNGPHSPRIQFFLYTNDNLEKTEIFVDGDLKLVNPNIPLKVLIHGWTESNNKTWYNDFINAYFTRGSYNVIAVNWNGLASDRYTKSAENTRIVGRAVGGLIFKLNETIGVPFSNVHLLGHSLGGHVAGFAGKHVIQLTKSQYKIQRITGLDPAGPLFENPLSSKSDRLSKDDANFVDIVHTDGGVFGYYEQIGHVDFYPNGGRALQPSCNLLNLAEIFSGVLEPFFCSHIKSHAYYIESINTEILARKCKMALFINDGLCDDNDQVVFGEDCPESARGVYYFKTNPNPHPYLLN